MVQTSLEMTGLEKASVLLMSLGSEASEEVMKRLSSEERHLLGAQVVRMRSVKSVVRERVLSEVSEAIKLGKSGSSYADATKPFQWLASIKPDQVADMLTGERPHTIALILSHLSPSMVSSVLACMDEKVRNQTARSLTRIAKVSDDVLRTIDETMRKRALGSSHMGFAISDLRFGGQSSSNRRSEILNDSAITSLEDLIQLPDSRLRELLGEVDLDDLCLALRVESDELCSTVLGIVPPTTSELIRQRLEATAQIKIREIDIARQRVLGAIRRAANADGLTEAMVE